MPSAKVTSKGQITLPIEVRATLGLRPGSRLSFVPMPAGGYEVHAVGTSIRDLKGVLAPPQHPVSLDDMDEAIAAGATAGTP